MNGSCLSWGWRVKIYKRWRLLWSAVIYWTGLVLGYTSPEAQNKSGETLLSSPPLPSFLLSHISLFFSSSLAAPKFHMCPIYHIDCITFSFCLSPLWITMWNPHFIPPLPRLQDFQMYCIFTSHQLLSLMICSNIRAGSAHDILNVTIKEACKISAFPLAYRCSVASSCRSCNLS